MFDDFCAHPVYSDFMDVAIRIACSYDVVDRSTTPLQAYTKGIGQTFAAFKAAGLEPTREQLGAILEHLHTLAQRDCVTYPEEGDPTEDIREAIEAVRRGEKP